MEEIPRTRFVRFARMLLRLGVWGCFAVAAWLAFVLVAVVPHRDPGGVPFWAAVTGGFAALGALGAWHLARPRAVLLRWAVGTAALGALGLGLLAVLSQVERMAASGGGFEGYLLLMGAVLVGLGGAALLHLFATRRRRARAPGSGALPAA